MRRKIPLRYLILFFFILYIGMLTVPYIPHKKVSPSFRESFHSRTFQASAPGTERIAYINDNTDALLYRLRMLEDAQEEIILSTFDFNADRGGKEIMSALLQAADRGVKVRVIVDGASGLIDMQLMGRPWFQALASHENISVKIYNPIHLLKPWKLQARLHDKYLIIDQQMYLLGGRNTTDLFLGDYTDKQNLDQELFVYETADLADSSLVQLQTYFESIWSLPDSRDYLCRRKTDRIQECDTALRKQYEQLKTIYPKAWEPWDYEALTFPADRITLLSNPIYAENKEPWMWYSLHQLMQQGSQVTIYTPYIICGDEMYEDLTSLTAQGIQTEIITNDVASGANPWGCTDYLNQRRRIRNTGVQVYEYMDIYSSHTKTVLIDDSISIIGSYNLDMRSTYQDTELMLVVDSEELNLTLRTRAERDKTYSKTADANGSYTFGENYTPGKESPVKNLFYSILRILIIPFRRFL